MNIYETHWGTRLVDADGLKPERILTPLVLDAR